MFIFLAILYAIIAVITGRIFEASKQYQGKPFAGLRCYAWGAVWPLVIVVIILENI